MIILVPTDFSGNATHALSFALQILQQTKGKLILMHVFHLKLGNTFHSVEALEKMEKEAFDDSRNELAAYWEKVKAQHGGLAASGMEIELTSRLGFAVEEVISLTERLPIDMVVMGTKGAGTVSTKLLGTNTSTVLENVECPVLVVPADAPGGRIDRMAMASDFKSTESAISLAKLAKLIGSELRLVYFGKSSSLSDTALHTYLEQVKAGSGNQNIEATRYDVEEVVDGINSYVEASGTTLLAMVRHDRSFFQRVFSPSLTRRMSLHSKVAMLAYYEK